MRWPLRERFRTQQVLALARANRQADALRAYDRARSLPARRARDRPGTRPRSGVPPGARAGRSALRDDLAQSAPVARASRSPRQRRRVASSVARESSTRSSISPGRASSSSAVSPGSARRGSPRKSCRPRDATARSSRSVVATTTRALRRCGRGDRSSATSTSTTATPSSASELADLFAQFEHVRRSLVELSRERAARDRAGRRAVGRPHLTPPPRVPRHRAAQRATSSSSSRSATPTWPPTLRSRTHSFASRVRVLCAGSSPACANRPSASSSRSCRGSRSTTRPRPSSPTEPAATRSTSARSRGSG